MITKEQLEKIGFKSTDTTLYYDVDTWDYQYNIKTQELFSHCEVYGETEFLARITSIEKFVELIENTKLNEEGMVLSQHNTPTYIQTLVSVYTNIGLSQLKSYITI